MKNKKLPIVYKIIIVVLTVALFIMTVGMVLVIRDDADYYRFSVDSLKYRLDDNDFYFLEYECAENAALLEKTAEEEKCLAALGKYYGYALPYYALKACNVARESRNLDHMNELCGEMGDYQKYTRIIDEWYGNPPFFLTLDK